MDPNRDFWSQQQQRLRQALAQPDHHAEAVDLFLEQHAMLHATGMAPGERWFFQDEVLNGLTEKQLRGVGRNNPHSIVWLIWHIARTEDVATNLLLAATAQVLETGTWNEKLNITARDIGTAMPDANVLELSARINLDALWAYRLAVGRRTREIVQQLEPGELRQAVEPERIQRVRDEGALIAAAWGVADYWARHPKANVLLIPATRHSFTHLNEARRLRPKRVS